MEPSQTKRAWVVIQAQALLNASHPSAYVIPLTTQLIENAEPLRIPIHAAQNLRRDSDLLMDQMRAIDNGRLVQRPLLRLPRATMRGLAQCCWSSWISRPERLRNVTDPEIRRAGTGGAILRDGSSSSAATFMTLQEHWLRGICLGSRSLEAATLPGRASVAQFQNGSFRYLTSALK